MAPQEAPEQTARAGEQPTTGPRTGAQAGAAAEQPKPPPEIADMMRTMGTRQRCTGTAMGGPDMNTEMKLTGTITNKVDLNGFFIRSVMNATMGEGRDAKKYTLESLSTYDPNARKWRSASAMSDGSFMVETSDGLTGGTMDSQAQAWGPMRAAQVREHVDASDPKNIKMTGEASTDEGKTWNKIYEMTCTK